MSINLPLGSLFTCIFHFFSVESIRGFTSTFVAICSATSYPFGFSSRRKRPSLDILKFIFATLSNRDKKISLIQVYEDGALERSSEFMKTYPPVVWTMMFMLWHVFINSEDLASAPSSSTLMNATFLSLFLNVVTKHFRVSRGVRLLLGGNPKGCAVAEHIATKFEVNPQMLSTLKNEKSIWSMNPGANFETSVVGPLGILVALVKIQIGQVSSNSGKLVGRPLKIPFLAICFSMVIETWPKRWWISW